MKPRDIQFSPELRSVQDYLREKAGLPPLPNPETELCCSTCEEWKPDSEFYRANDRPKNRNRKSECKTCVRIRKRRWRADNPGRDAKKSRKYRARKKNVLP